MLAAVRRKIVASVAQSKRLKPVSHMRQDYTQRIRTRLDRRRLIGRRMNGRILVHSTGRSRGQSGHAPSDLSMGLGTPVVKVFSTQNGTAHFLVSVYSVFFQRHSFWTLNNINNIHIIDLAMYTVSQKKSRPILRHNLGKCWPILKTLSLLDSARNFQQNCCYISHRRPL